MIEIKEGEGLCEYIRRHEKMQEELSKISGVPASLMGSNEKLRSQGVAGLTIIGNEKFIKEFKRGIENVTLRKK